MPLRERTRRLEQTLLGLRSPIELCQTTTDRQIASAWFVDLAATPIALGSGPWHKLKTRSELTLVATAVIGDPAAPTALVLSLPTGHDLHQVGVTSVLSRALARDLARLIHLTGQTLRRYPSLPGTQPVSEAAQIEAFVEVDADVAIDNGRLRHAVRLRRARPDLTVDDLLPVDDGEPDG